MTFALDTQVPVAGKKIKINWAQECVTGALLSAAFTVLAANAGTGGVMPASLADHVHEFIIMGGVAMGLICGLSAVVLIFIQILRDIFIHLTAKRENAAKTGSWFGQLQAVRFVKIFLP